MNSPVRPEDQKTHTTSGKLNFSARFMAVQAVYEWQMNKRPAADLIRDGMQAAENTLSEDEDDDYAYSKDYNKGLYSAVVQGVENRAKDLESLVEGHYNSEIREIEYLLKAVLLCGGYEIMAHTDIDVPVIINDYLDITHSFYSKSEASLVNGMLDRLSKTLRDAGQA